MDKFLGGSSYADHQRIADESRERATAYKKNKIETERSRSVITSGGGSGLVTEIATEFMGGVIGSIMGVSDFIFNPVEEYFRTNVSWKFWLISCSIILISFVSVVYFYRGDLFEALLFGFVCTGILYPSYFVVRFLTGIIFLVAWGALALGLLAGLMIGFFYILNLF